MVKLRRHIALVGLPGAGKSRVGSALAAQLGRSFADSDEEVERFAGASVSSIFADQGEATFRTLEREAIKRLIHSDLAVIALGGGGFQNPSVRELLLAAALVIWLDVPEEVLIERLERSGGRPLLSGGDLRTRLRALSAERLPGLAQAHLRVAAATSAEMTEKILSLLDHSDIAATSASR